MRTVTFSGAKRKPNNTKSPNNKTKNNNNNNNRNNNKNNTTTTTDTVPNYYRAFTLKVIYKKQTLFPNTNCKKQLITNTIVISPAHLIPPYRVERFWPWLGKKNYCFLAWTDRHYCIGTSKLRYQRTSKSRSC